VCAEEELVAEGSSSCLLSIGRLLEMCLIIGFDVMIGDENEIIIFQIK
jgi:hypothetical protein